ARAVGAGGAACTCPFQDRREYVPVGSLARVHARERPGRGMCTPHRETSPQAVGYPIADVEDALRPAVFRRRCLSSLRWVEPTRIVCAGADAGACGTNHGRPTIFELGRAEPMLPPC